MTWKKGCKKLCVQKSIKNAVFFSMGFRASLKINKDERRRRRTLFDYYFQEHPDYIYSSLHFTLEAAFKEWNFPSLKINLVWLEKTTRGR